MIRHPPRSTLFPSTPLFGSDFGRQSLPAHVRGEGHSQSDAEPLWRFPRRIVVGEIVLRKAAERWPRDADAVGCRVQPDWTVRDRKSTRLNSSHLVISYAVFC